MSFKFDRAKYPAFYPTETYQDDATFTVDNWIAGQALPVRPFLWAVDPAGLILPLQVKSCSKFRWTKTRDGRQVPIGLDADFSGSDDQSEHMIQTLRTKKRQGWVLLRDLDDGTPEAAKRIEDLCNERLAISTGRARDSEAKMTKEAQAQVTAEIAGRKKGR